MAPSQPLELNSYQDKVFVHLRAGEKFAGLTILAIVEPTLDESHLSGFYRQEEVRVPVSLIDHIEIVKVDKKRVIIGGAIFLALVGIGIELAIVSGRANVD